MHSDGEGALEAHTAALEAASRFLSYEYSAILTPKPSWRKRIAKLLDRLTDLIDPPRVR